MRVVHDAETDTLTITLRDAPVRESEEARPGVILDYAADGTLVGVEILDATRRVGGPERERVLADLRAREGELRERFAVRRLELFGSVARGEARPDSDVDLLVEFDRPVGLLHLGATSDFIAQALGREVDLILRRAVIPELQGRVYGEAVGVF